MAKQSGGEQPPAISTTRTGDAAFQADEDVAEVRLRPWLVLRLQHARSRIARFRTHGGGNEFFRRRRFRTESPQCLRRILQQLEADRPLSIHEAAKRSFVNAEAPRGSSRAAEYLDAVREMSGEVRWR